MLHRETIQKVKRAVSGGEYGENQNKRLSPEMMEKVKHVQEMPKRVMKKMMSSGGYMIKKMMK